MSRRFLKSEYITTGSVGININSPLSYLHINNNSTTPSICINQTSGAAVLLGSATGTAADNTYGGSIVALNKNSSGFTQAGLWVGKSATAQNAFGLNYTHISDNNTTNSFAITGWGLNNFVIDGNGFCGIGSNSAAPAGIPLYVHGSSTSSIGSCRYMEPSNLGAQFVQSGAGNQNVSIYTADRFLTSQIECASDIRIKKDIIPLDNFISLNLIRKINPVQYKYRDVIKKGDNPVYGFIAQEVDDVIDYCSSLIQEYVPNIYTNATVDPNDNTMITLNNNDNSINLNDILKSGDSLRMYNKNNTEFIVNVKEIKDNNTVVVDQELTEDGFFVFGNKVNDFHILNEECIFTHGISALKELIQQMDSLPDIDTRDSIITSLENQINQLELTC